LNATPIAKPVRLRAATVSLVRTDFSFRTTVVSYATPPVSPVPPFPTTVSLAALMTYFTKTPVSTLVLMAFLSGLSTTNNSAQLVMNLAKHVEQQARIVFLAKILFSSLRMVSVFCVTPHAKLVLELKVIIVCLAKMECIYKTTNVWNVQLNAHHVQMKQLVIFVKMGSI
jgi:hypothetical protein